MHLLASHYIHLIEFRVKFYLKQATSINYNIVGYIIMHIKISFILLNDNAH